MDPEVVVEAVEKGMRDTGTTSSALSLSRSDYLRCRLWPEIKNRLKDENVTLSLPSQRIDRFDDSVANILGGAGKGLTLAPEAGTQRSAISTRALER